MVLNYLANFRALLIRVCITAFFFMTFMTFTAFMAGPAHAKAVAKILQNSSCTAYKIDGKRKRVYKAKLPFPPNVAVSSAPAAGRNFYGFKVKSSSTYDVIRNSKYSKDFYMADRNCLYPKVAETEAPSAPIVSVNIKSQIKTPNKWVPTLYLQTIRTKYTVTLPSESTTSISGNTTGMAAEISRNWYRGRSVYSAAAAGFWGISEIGRSSDERNNGDLNNFEYQAKNIISLGGEASFAYLIAPFDATNWIGVKMPIRWTHTPVPQPPDTTYTVGPINKISVSYLLEARLQTGPFTWIQNYGIYGSWGNIIWSLGMSYEF